jgi:dsDNA-specific endonuclease/ATPase MutS2
MPIIQIGDKAIDVQDEVHAYITGLNSRVEGLEQRISTAKQEAIQELKEAQEREEIIGQAKALGMQIDDSVSIDYLRGLKASFEVAKNVTAPKAGQTGVIDYSQTGVTI